MRLKVILFRAAYNLPVTAGLARGFFSSHGVDLDIVYTRGSRMTIDALTGGECDLGVLAADDVVYEVEAHCADLIAFMGLHAGILHLVARPGITDARQLAGKRLGVDDPASGFAIVAHKILERLGLKRSEYATIAAGGHEPRSMALREGRIDVAISTPPFSLELVSQGFTLLARARDYIPRYQASCGVTTRRWTGKRENARALAAYVRAYRESVEWVLDPANRATAVGELAAEFGLKPELAESTYAALADRSDGLFPDARIDVPGVQTVLDLRVDTGLLTAPTPDPSKYYDARWLVERS